MLSCASQSLRKHLQWAISRGGGRGQGGSLNGQSVLNAIRTARLAAPLVSRSFSYWANYGKDTSSSSSSGKARVERPTGSSVRPASPSASASASAYTRSGLGAGRSSERKDQFDGGRSPRGGGEEGGGQDGSRSRTKSPRSSNGSGSPSMRPSGDSHMSRDGRRDFRKDKGARKDGAKPSPRGNRHAAEKEKEKKEKDRQRPSKATSSSSSSASSESSTAIESQRVSAFLEMNPYMCSGCGAPFQSKSPGEPGYLSKDLLQEHRSQAGFIKDKQDAVRILQQSGLELDGPAAMEVLLSAGVKANIIEAVQALGQAVRSGASRLSSDLQPQSPSQDGDRDSALTADIDKAEALRVLELAGVDPQSEAAASLLRGARVSENTIRSLQYKIDEAVALAASLPVPDPVSVPSAPTADLSANANHRDDKKKKKDGAPSDPTVGGSAQQQPLEQGFTRFGFVDDDPFEAAEARVLQTSASTSQQRGVDGGEGGTDFVPKVSSSVDDEEAAVADDEDDDDYDGDDDSYDDDDSEMQEGTPASTAQTLAQGSGENKSQGKDRFTYTDFGAELALQTQLQGDLSSILKRNYPKTKSDKPGSPTVNATAAASSSAAASSPSAAHLAHTKVCQRCFRLHEYGQIDEALRPGWAEDKHELLTPAHFSRLLGVIRESSCVVLCLVDVFDLEGTILTDLRAIAGKNPVLIAANKFDLLPRDVSETRLLNWIQSELKDRCGFKTPREMDQHRHAEVQKQGWVEHKGDSDEEGILRRQNIHLVSCTSGYGIKKLMDSALAIAADNGDKIFVMGAANVGKSSFINQLLETSYTVANGGKKRVGGKKPTRSEVPTTTVSNLPGTTLNFIKLRVPSHAGISIYDTPGLLNDGQLTTRLNTAELRQVIPVTPVLPVTFRVQEGKTVLIGGLAQVELLEGLPFYFTFFVSNEVKLHPTDADPERVTAFLERHVGDPHMLTPPSSMDRRKAFEPFQEYEFDVRGAGWNESACDLVVAGLGWVSITGSGRCRVRVTAPAGVRVSQRPPLLPFEANASTAKFSGGRILKKSKKPHEKGKVVRSYGWRA